MDYEKAMMITMISVTDITERWNSYHIKQLYELLEERLTEPNINISHTKMPTWEEHVYFCTRGSGYKHHYVLTASNDARHACGVLYVTNKNEIGLHLRKCWRGQGIGSDVLELFLEQYPGVYLANINPKNANSIAFFKRNGFQESQGGIIINGVSVPSNTDKQITLVYSKQKGIIVDI